MVFFDIFQLILASTFWKVFCHKIFVFLVRDLKFWLLAYFLSCWAVQEFRQDWTTLILDIYKGPSFEFLVDWKIKKYWRGDPYKMLSNLAENLHSSAEKKISKQPKFEVSNSKNKNLVTQCSFQNVWKILLSKNVNSEKCLFFQLII